MCIIIVKPVGVALPPTEHVSEAFQRNPDGFGLAYWNKGMHKVRLTKGAMTARAARIMISDVPEPQGKVIVMHFRNATEGRVTPANCHPFPLTNNKKLLKATDLAADLVLAHNGIILNMDTAADTTPKMQREISDTARFIKEYLSGLGKTLLKIPTQRLLRRAADSRYAILAPSALHLVGEFKQDGGCYYSNETYKPVGGVTYYQGVGRPHYPCAGRALIGEGTPHPNLDGYFYNSSVGMYTQKLPTNPPPNKVHGYIYRAPSFDQCAFCQSFFHTNELIRNNETILCKWCGQAVEQKLMEARDGIGDLECLIHDASKDSPIVTRIPVS